MTYLESIFKVLVVGLVLGAGLPAIFAVGMVAYSEGAGGQKNDGTMQAHNPALKYLGILLFLFVAWVIVTAVAWITSSTLSHHFGFDPFPFIKSRGRHMTENHTVLDKVLRWLHDGYPEG